MDLFSTNVLLGIVQSLIRPPSFFLDLYFPTESYSEVEEIHFDLITKRRRLTPFVSPLVAGQVVKSLGYKTTTFRPAYCKDKRIFDVLRPYRRAPGERIGGGVVSPMERMQVVLASELKDQLEMLTRRREVMAAEALATGKTTISGDDYPTVVIDFGRDPALTIPLTSSARWGETDVKPLDNLHTWAQTLLQKGGGTATDVIMDMDAWNIFSADATVIDRLRLWNSLGNEAALGSPLTEGGTYMGTFDRFNFYLYAGWYEDASGTEQPILPQYSVLMGSTNLLGVQAFGAILDYSALKSVPYYPKSWEEPDPSIRYLLMQSAPLVVPTRANAFLGATVR